jgi:hypothetical protein
VFPSLKNVLGNIAYKVLMLLVALPFIAISFSIVLLFSVLFVIFTYVKFDDVTKTFKIRYHFTNKEVRTI